MRAVDLFPYWADNRALLVEVVSPLNDEHLEAHPAAGLRSLGDILRHIITTEEFWWRGGMLGEPFSAWRPEGWEAFADAQKEAYRLRRFPDLAAIRQGLEAAHTPVAEFLEATDAVDLCEKRRSAWGEDNTLRWILWHLVEHDQHHRGQIYTRMRLLGYDPPSTFPRPAVMGSTPAAHWDDGEEEIRNLVPFWNQVRSRLREAVATLTDDDLAFTPAPEFPSVHDMILHIFIWEDFLIRQNLQGQMDQAWWKIEGSDWRSTVPSLAKAIGSRFPTVTSLLEGLDAVGAATKSFTEGLTLDDLVTTHPTSWGSETLHHTLWYAREHMVHHRAQIFLRMRMMGRTPPDI